MISCIVLHLRSITGVNGALWGFEECGYQTVYLIHVQCLLESHCEVMLVLLTIVANPILTIDQFALVTGTFSGSLQLMIPYHFPIQLLLFPWSALFCTVLVHWARFNCAMKDRFARCGAFHTI